ncbi:unnamed protein product, partial [Adineta steineri]
LLNAIDWLLCYIVDKSIRKLEQLTATKDLSSFDLKNTAQVYHLRTLAIIYIQRTSIIRFSQLLNLNNDIDDNCKIVLEKLLLVHILKLFEEYLTLLYEGHYIQNNEINQWIQTRLLDLCYELRHDLVSLVDVFAPPDHILNSVLGINNGQVYKAINNMIHSNKQTFLTPLWLSKDLFERSKL